jgi:hypothetical protein
MTGAPRPPALRLLPLEQIMRLRLLPPCPLSISIMWLDHVGRDLTLDHGSDCFSTFLDRSNFLFESASLLNPRHSISRMVEIRISQRSRQLLFIQKSKLRFRNMERFASKNLWQRAKLNIVSRCPPDFYWHNHCIAESSYHYLSTKLDSLETRKGVRHEIFV